MYNLAMRANCHYGYRAIGHQRAMSKAPARLSVTHAVKICATTAVDEKSVFASGNEIA
jgi:hypothetical protein